MIRTAKLAAAVLLVAAGCGTQSTYGKGPIVASGPPVSQQGYGTPYNQYNQPAPYNAQYNQPAPYNTEYSQQAPYNTQYNQPAYGETSTSADGSLNPGATLEVQLDTPISPERSRPGDAFMGHIARPVVDTNGQVLVPQGAPVTGQISDIQPGYGDQPVAARLAVTSIDMAGVREPVVGTIVRADPPRRIRGLDVGIGAGAGALLGAILDGGKGAVVGGVLGAGAGTLVSLGRHGDHNELPRDTMLSVQLQSPLRTLAQIQGGYRAY
jgi:hypothetical protein